MRLARINGVDIDIDDKTAIGVTLQSYDIKNVGKRFIKTTNAFSIPTTNKNLGIFGNPQSPHSISRVVYERAIFNYWVDNEQLITNAGLRLEYIQDRIYLFAFEKPSVWDEIKLVKWPVFMEDFVKWLQRYKGLPSKKAPFNGTFTNFLTPYANATQGVKLPFAYGNLFNFVDGGAYVEDGLSLWLRYWTTSYTKADGGHFCVYIKTIFEYIEYKYGVNFLTGSTDIIGNIWNDEIAPKIYTPIRDIAVRHSTGGYYFEFDEAPIFEPLKDQKDKADKTLHDCVNGFMQHFNVIIDDLTISGSSAIRLARFDDMVNKAEVIDWSPKMTGVPKYKPSIQGYTLKNTIKFGTVFENGDSTLNSKVLTCSNLNLDATSDLFTIDAHVCPFVELDSGVVPDLSAKEAFKTFTYLLDADLMPNYALINLDTDGQIHQASIRLKRAALYSLNSEYNLIDTILKEPKTYEVEKWLTITDIKDFQFFRLYYIQALGGAFFVNKITGFNPQMSTTPTKIEIVKVSNKTPLSPPDLNVWVDGVGDYWTDGIGDYWY